MASTTIVLPSHAYRIRPRRALGVAAACWGGFLVVVWLVAKGHAAGIDQAGLLFWRDPDLNPRGSARLAESVRDVTALGGILLRNLFAILAIVALLFMRLRREAALLFLTVTLAWIVNSAIKGLVGRPRPEIVPHLMDAGGNSFPSGHSFNAAVVYISMALAFAALSNRQSVRMTVIALAIVASMAIAWSRVWLGVHWPTDVIAGWLGGAGWAFLASALLYRPSKIAIETVSPAPDTVEPGSGPSPRR